MIGAAALFVVISAAPSVEDIVRSPEAARLVRRVEAALEADPATLLHHRNYLRYLDSQPNLRQIEDRYTNGLVRDRFGELAGQFEDELLAERDARTLFEAYNAFLSRNAAERDEVNALYRIQLARPEAAAEFDAWLGGLAASVDSGPRTRPASASWASISLRSVFSGEPETRQTVANALESLRESPGVRQALLPWWEASRSGDSELGRRFQRLNEYLIRDPKAFWTWQDRSAAWASHPGMLAWVQEFHGRIRDSASLNQDYYTYLDILRRHPVLRDSAEARWGEYADDAAMTDPRPGGPSGATSRQVGEPRTESLAAPPPPVVARPRVAPPDAPDVPDPKSPSAPRVAKPLRPAPP